MSISNAAVYARQSHGKMSSVEDQIADARVLATENGWTIERTYSDRVSASPLTTKVREDWPKLLDDIRDGVVDVVICWDVSRLSREMDSWPQVVTLCGENKVAVYALRDERTFLPWLPSDRKALLDAGSNAEYESLIKSKDVSRGTAKAAQKGKGHGPAAYGWTRVYDGVIDGKLTFHEVINEEQAVIVREIITKVAKRVPISELMRDLNSRGVSSPTGGKWSRTGLVRLAQNPRYIAVRQHQRTIKGVRVGKVTEYQAAWPPIMATPEERKTFAQAVAVLGEEGRKRSAPGALRYLLSYLMVCETCGGPVNVQPPRQGRPARYRCLDAGHLSVTVTDADAVVQTLVCQRLARSDARQLFAPNGEVEQTAQAELARLERSVELNRQAYENDVIDAEAYGRKRRKLEPELLAAKKKVADLGKGNELRNLLGDLKDGEFTLDVILPRWNALSVVAKRTVIKALVEKVTVGPTTVALTRWSSTEERLDAAADRLTVEWVEESEAVVA